MISRLHVYSTERTNEVVRRIRLWSDNERYKSTAGGITVRVGIANGDKIKWLGGWSQFRSTLKSREYLDLTGIPDLNHPLILGDVCVIEVTSQGVPGQSTQGMSVEWKFARVGATTTDPVARRLDGVDPYPRPRGTRPLFSLGREISDPALRAAITPLEESLNISGVTEWVLSAPLPALGGNTTEAAAAGHHFDYGHTVVPGVAPAPGVLLTTAPLVLTPPDPSVPYRCTVTAGVAVTEVAPGPANYGEIHLYDNTQGVPVCPDPTSRGRGAKIADAGTSPGTDFNSVTIANHGFVVPAGTGSVSLDLYGTDVGGVLEYVDPWITARLYRDPYVV